MARIFVVEVLVKEVYSKETRIDDSKEEAEARYRDEEFELDYSDLEKTLFLSESEMKRFNNKLNGGS